MPDLHTEFKGARSAVPKSLFDTVCAFLNTDGGTVYLGIDDQGKVTGVNPSGRHSSQTRNRRHLEQPAKIGSALSLVLLNPSICKFMIQLGRFDELGSGVINIHKYFPAFSFGAQPLFEDTREGFRLTLPLSLLSHTKSRKNLYRNGSNA